MFNFHQHFYYFDKRSLYIFNSEWGIRKAIVWLVEWLWFKIFILLTVIANSFLIASHNYEFRIDVTKEENTKFEILAIKVFLIIFIAEFVLKVVAMGLIVSKNSYMRSGWNLLDFVCLVTAILEQSKIDMETFIIFRVLRVLKPLRSIKAIPSL